MPGPALSPFYELTHSVLMTNRFLLRRSGNLQEITWPWEPGTSDSEAHASDPVSQGVVVPDGFQ